MAPPVFLLYSSPMEFFPFLIVALASSSISLLTFYSGFGLGTLLMPVFTLFFPVELAIAMTAVVHLLNNLFKVAVIGRAADKKTVFGFGLPAMAGAFAGSWILLKLGNLAPIFEYHWTNHTFEITPIKIVLSVMIALFAWLEISPRFQALKLDRKFLSLGGAVSGFFGGLSGHQGALRSAFLIRIGLSKEAFIATGVWIACAVDLTRLPVYLTHLNREGMVTGWPLVIWSSLWAFAGVLLGNRWLHKWTIQKVQIIVSGLLFSIALALGMGLI